MSDLLRNYIQWNPDITICQRSNGIRSLYRGITSVFEIVPRCFPSYLPLIANGINKYATQRNMRLNEKKCKEMVITFLKYQPSPVPPMFLNGAAIVRVSSFKLLGVTLSNDLSWNDHCDEIFKKACKRLYALRSLKAAGLNQKRPSVSVL